MENVCLFTEGYDLTSDELLKRMPKERAITLVQAILRKMEEGLDVPDIPAAKARMEKVLEELKLSQPISAVEVGTTIAGDLGLLQRTGDSILPLKEPNTMSNSPVHEIVQPEPHSTGPDFRKAMELPAPLAPNHLVNSPHCRNPNGHLRQRIISGKRNTNFTGYATYREL